MSEVICSPNKAKARSKACFLVVHVGFFQKQKHITPLFCLFHVGFPQRKSEVGTELALARVPAVRDGSQIQGATENQDLL